MREILLFRLFFFFLALAVIPQVPNNAFPSKDSHYFKRKSGIEMARGVERYVKLECTEVNIK